MYICAYISLLYGETSHIFMVQISKYVQHVCHIYVNICEARLIQGFTSGAAQDVSGSFVVWFLFFYIHSYAIHALLYVLDVACEPSPKTIFCHYW